MRVLLSTCGSRGDTEPVAALAVRLRDQGAQVRVCAPPDFTHLFDRAKIEMVPAGPAVREISMGPRQWQPQDLPRHAHELITAQFAAIDAAAEDCDAVVATGMIPAVAAARSVAEKRGIRFVHASFFSTMLPSPHRPPMTWGCRALPSEVTDNERLWELDATGIHELFGPTINDHRVSIGLPSLDNVRDHLFTTRPWLATDPVLDPWQPTADLHVTQTGAWVLPDESRLSDQLREFLDAGEPPVYVGFGSMPTQDPEMVARSTIAAIRAHDRRAIVSAGWAELVLIDEGEDCFAVGEVNQQALFGQVAAVIHHGGAGTTTTAARAGAAQVLIPQAADQPYWASRVIELGIGAAVEEPVPTAEALSAALDTALSASTQQRAATVAGQIRTDGAALAAKLLLDGDS